VASQKRPPGIGHGKPGNDGVNGQGDGHGLTQGRIYFQSTTLRH